jgi:hypothetical protein
VFKTTKKEQEEVKDGKKRVIHNVLRQKLNKLTTLEFVSANKQKIQTENFFLFLQILSSSHHPSPSSSHSPAAVSPSTGALVYIVCSRRKKKFVPAALL